MAEKRAKKLTINEIKKQYSNKFKELEKEVEIDGEKFKFTYLDSFPLDRQMSAMNRIEDIVNKDIYQEFKSEEESEEFYTSLTTIIILDELTSIEFPKDDTSESLMILGYLAELGILTDILEVLPSEEITKFFDKVRRGLDESRENIEKMVQEYNEQLREQQVDVEEAEKLKEQAEKELQEEEDSNKEG